MIDIAETNDGGNAQLLNVLLLKAVVHHGSATSNTATRRDTIEEN